jgi:hypothetical protein
VALFCIGTASVFGWLLAYYQIPKALLANVTEWGLGPIRRGLPSCRRVPGGGLLPGRDSGHHHRRHDPAAAGRLGRPAPGIVRDASASSPWRSAWSRHPTGMCLMISCAVAKVPLKFALKDTMIMLVPMLLVLCASSSSGLRMPLLLPRWVSPIS